LDQKNLLTIVTDTWKVVNKWFLNKYKNKLMKTQHEVMESTLYMKPEVLHFGLGSVTNLLCDVDNHVTLLSARQSSMVTSLTGLSWGANEIRNGCYTPEEVITLFVIS
jgi:hypothetical protein